MTDVQQEQLLRLLQEVAVAANQADTVEDGVGEAIQKICALFGWPIGHFYLCDPECPEHLIGPLVSHVADPDRFASFHQASRSARFKTGVGLPGRVLAQGRPVCIEDLSAMADFPRAPMARAAGVCAGLAFPVIVRSEVAGVLEFFSVTREQPSALLLEVMGQVGTQLGRLIERQRAEEALKASELKFRSVTQAAHDAIVACDSKGKVISWNRGAEQIFGYSEPEMLGQSLARIMPEPYRQAHEQGMQRASSTGEHRVLGKRLELQGLRKDQSVFPMELTIGSWQVGEAVYYSGVIRDVSERKQAEERIRQLNADLEARVHQRTLELEAANRALRKEIDQRARAEASLAAEKERLAVTLMSIGDGVITADTAGRVVLLNKMAQELTGWSQSQALGKRTHEVFRIVHERTREPCEDPVTKVLKTEHIIGLANGAVLIANDGKERMVADSAAPIRHPDGRVMGVVLVFRDVTHERKLEEELFRARNLESIGLLAAGIAHDFNNVLMAILGNVSLAKGYAQPGDEAFTVLEEAEKGFVRARDLTQQLLTFAKGGAPIKKTDSVVELIAETTRFALRGSAIRSELDLPADVWPVDFDAGQLSQAINNLVINAKQAMPAGGSLSVRAENVTLKTPEGGAPQRYVRITLGDTGGGIAPAHIDKIFDPYFTTKRSGSGLGLATVYSIVKKHEGAIRVESELGRGTRSRRARHRLQRLLGR